MADTEPTTAASDDERELAQWEPDIIEKSGKPEDYVTDSTPATAASQKEKVHHA